MTFDEYQAWAGKVSGLREYVGESHATSGYHRNRSCVETRIEIDNRLPPALPLGVVFVRVDHGAAGIASEAGEIAEHVKHVRFHGKALDKDHLVKELGDLLWYIAETATGLGISLEDVAARNIAKLKARYPEGHFTIERSENRNPESE